MRYFLAALLAGPARLEKIPVFALAALALVGLAVFHTPLWLVGLPVVAITVAMLARNPRYRKVVDARSHGLVTNEGRDEYQTVSSQIKIETRSRLGILERKSERILEQQRGGGSDEFVLDANQDALRQLRLIFAKLLLTRQQLLTEDFAASSEKVRREIEGVQAVLQDATTSDTERTSHTATLSLLQQRLDNLAMRAQKVEEIEGDLKRIEAHFELALAQASDRDRPQGITTDIGLVSEGLHGNETTVYSAVTSQLTPQ